MAKDIMDKCRSCGQPLRTMIAYLPYIGEVCYDRYKKAAKKSEFPTKPR